MADERKIKKIRSSLFERGLSLAKLTVTTGAKIASHGATTLLSDPESKASKWNKLLQERAFHLAGELGELKGSLMKAGQMLSMYGEHFLPPEVNSMLKSLQAQSPPLEWKAIEKILRQRLSPEQWDQLEISEESIGSASLGQVHKAKIKSTGEIIALKIQYPGVEKAIESDLRALRTFLGLMQVIPRGVSTDALFAEIKTMLVQEMDYRHEALETQKYYDRLKEDKRYVVPRIYPEFCGDQIIATSFETGISPDDPAVMALSQERRNRLGLSFLELYYKELFDWGVIQTDPHLGNYRVRLNEDGEDQLVLLDFGAVKSYERTFLNDYHRMIKAALMNDSKLLRESSMSLKFIEENDDPGLVELFETFCMGTIEPFMSFEDPRNKGQINSKGEYDWKGSALPERLTKIVFQMVQKFKLRAPPQEILFLDRKTAGVFIFLSVMRARINSRPLLLDAFARNKI